MAVVAVLCVSSGSLAGLLHQRFFSDRSEAFLVVHVTVMAAVFGIALVAVELPRVTDAPWPRALAGLPVGVACGIAAVPTELLIKRRARSRRRFVTRPNLSPGRAGPFRSDVGSLVPREVTAPPRRLPAILGLLVLAGTLEEVLFRGVAVDLALDLPSRALGAACVVAVTACFALSHLPLGWADVVAKLPLGLLALAVTFAFGSIIPAAAAHVVFNIAMWRALPAVREIS